MQGQICDGVARISYIHRLARLVVVGQFPYIDYDLVIRRAAVLLPDLVHWRPYVVHARLIRGRRRTAVVLREPETHDAGGAGVAPVPLADRGGGGGHGGADVVDHGETVVPDDVLAGTIVEEEGAVWFGGGDADDGAVTGVVGCDDVLDEGAAWVNGDGGYKRESRGEEREDEVLKRGSISHIGVFGCI